jgi:hypothetical protein
MLIQVSNKGKQRLRTEFWIIINNTLDDTNIYSTITNTTANYDEDTPIL